MLLVIQHMIISKHYTVLNLISYRLFWNGFYLINDSGDNCKKFDESLLWTVSIGSLNLSEIYWWLVVDTFVYLVLYNYFVCIFPGKYGHAKSWLFPVETLWTWIKKCFGKKRKVIVDTANKRC